MQGRPTDLTYETADIIVRYVKAGANREGAASAAGINVATLYRWLERGDRGEEPYAALTKRVRRADAEYQLTVLRALKKRSLKDPRAAVAYWQSRYAGAFKAQIELTGRDG